ncbi:MAG: UDP-N-acetylglucosamine 2-epimerase [Acidimicrobiales bacterium]
MTGTPASDAGDRRHVLFVTGTRADYGKLKSVIRAVDQADDFDYTIFATGMHLLDKYGTTWKEIEKDGFAHIFLYFNQDHFTDSMMDRVLADTIKGISHYVAEHQVDLIVVHGDRVEALAGAIVGSLNGILVGHIEGGELSGTVDELMRHTITKMSHLHFVSNDEASRRVVGMGEYADKVHVIGSPNIDIMLSPSLPPFDDVRRHYELPDGEFALVALHPVVGASGELHDDAASLLAALSAMSTSGRRFVVLYPNNDPGGGEILRAIREVEDDPAFRVLPSMKFESYLTALRHSAVLVGNSSSGIHEAPVYGVPTVNIGSRQHNRFDHPSIQHVAFDTDSIVKAVDHAWGTRFEPTMHFGSGTSASSFLAVLRRPDTWSTTVLKQFSD